MNNVYDVEGIEHRINEENIELLKNLKENNEGSVFILEDNEHILESELVRIVELAFGFDIDITLEEKNPMDTNYLFTIYYDEKDCTIIFDNGYQHTLSYEHIDNMGITLFG